MKTPVNWSIPARVWLQFGAMISVWYAAHLYYSKHSFAGMDPMVWVFVGIGVACFVIHVLLWNHWKTFDAEIYAALRTPKMVENEKLFAAYVAFRQGEGPLPQKCPMTRSEYIDYLEKDYPKALTAYARAGMQLSRPRIMQYIDPFFNFKGTEERAEYATQYFDFLNLYMTEYPEFEAKK